jgi:hypothetical protein
MADQHCVLVRAVGRELDSLREEASCTAHRCRTGWWAERRAEGTAFCFENANAKIIFLAYCARQDIPCVELR